MACTAVWMEHQAGVLPHVIYSHAGICPNDMNPNLWVDAMSTCTRECESDKVKQSFKKMLFAVTCCEASL